MQLVVVDKVLPEAFAPCSCFGGGVREVVGYCVLARYRAFRPGKNRTGLAKRCAGSSEGIRAVRGNGC